MYDQRKAHYIVVTAIIVKDGKYLIAKRSEKEAAFPGLWTVPGGKLNMQDYTDRPKDTGDLWYNIFEDLVRREVKEEVNLEIKNIGYVTSIAYIRSDNIPTIIVSMYADYAKGEVLLSHELIEYAWVNLEEAKCYHLIDGIYEELELFNSRQKGMNEESWTNRPK